jgi:hypothetical protein
MMRCCSDAGKEMSSKDRSSTTEFLNVDLDIYAQFDLQPIVSRLGKKVTVLYVGRERRIYNAHLEVAAVTKSADSTIRRFCGLIQALPTAERQLWNRAKRRDFSIGVQAGEQPNSCDFAVEAETVQAVAQVGARIVLTVYSPRMVS